MGFSPGDREDAEFRRDEALQWVRRHPRSPNNFIHYNDLIESSVILEEPTKALHYAEEAEKAGFGNMCWHTYGMAYTKLLYRSIDWVNGYHTIEEVLVGFSKFSETDPLSGFLNLGKLFESIGRHDAAITYYLKALKTEEPDSAKEAVKKRLTRILSS